MQLSDYVSKQKFDSLSRLYFSRTGLPVSLVNLNGEDIYIVNACRLCTLVLKKKPEMLEKNCRLKKIKTIEEAFRWGEGYITTCPLGLIMFGIPVVYEGKLIGGFLSGFAIFPEMKEDISEEINENIKKYLESETEKDIDPSEIDVFSLSKVREYVSYLFELTKKNHINDFSSLKDRNERYIQQYKIANFLDDLKKESSDISRKILDKQDEIISKVKLGDKTGAREILNEFLGSIFFDSGMNFEIIKVRILELIVIISRSAIEAGVDAKELLGLNFSYLTELNKATDLDELLFKLTDILENFIHKVSFTIEKKKKIKSMKMSEYINQNFTNRIAASEVADHVGLSVGRALHLFKEEFGLSMSGYIKKLRIDYGKYLLKNTDISLAELSNEVGFFDQSHFTKTFKKYEKMTPSHFRKRFRRDELLPFSEKSA